VTRSQKALFKFPCSVLVSLYVITKVSAAAVSFFNLLSGHFRDNSSAATAISKNGKEENLPMCLLEMLRV